MELPKNALGLAEGVALSLLSNNPIERLIAAGSAGRPLPEPQRMSRVGRRFIGRYSCRLFAAESA
jgi:hypothetical protein